MAVLTGGELERWVHEDLIPALQKLRDTELQYVADAIRPIFEERKDAVNRLHDKLQAQPNRAQRRQAKRRNR